MIEQVLTLANDRVRVSVAPEFGARVTELVDLESGRNWLVQGPLVGSGSSDARYLGDEARGWDECFPTVAPCSHPDWPSPLRDHGEIWGRQSQCELSGNSLLSSSRAGDILFERSLTLDDRSITVRYRLENIGQRSVPWMWSQHCLLAARPGDELFLSGVEGGLTMSTPGELDNARQASFQWPRFNDELHDLRMLTAHPGAWACKAYGSVSSLCKAGIDSDQGGIRLHWHAEQMPFIGVWLNQGAWPEANPVHQVAFEPTSAPVDDLQSAEKAGHERWLSAGSRHEWTCFIELTETNRMARTV